MMAKKKNQLLKSHSSTRKVFWCPRKKGKFEKVDKKIKKIVNKNLN